MPLGLEVQGDGVSEMKSFAQVLTKVGLAGVRRSLLELANRDEDLGSGLAKGLSSSSET